jgi:predicted RND superfamily exporter protein
MVKPWYMKYKLVGIAILIASFLLVSFFFLLWMSDRNYFENVRRNQNNFSRVETIQLTEHSTSSTVSISAEYPKVISIANADTEREINHKLHEKVQMIVENFKKEKHVQ